jgi:alpha-ketoglutarate-dependent taurine dioxygenase
MVTSDVLSLYSTQPLTVLSLFLWFIQDTHPAYHYVPGHPHITVLENDRDRPSLIEQWHTDMTFRQNPPLGSILHGVIIPPGGKGDTEFLSLSAALEVLICARIFQCTHISSCCLLSSLVFSLYHPRFDASILVCLHES